jgi:hypothetical protein
LVISLLRSISARTKSLIWSVRFRQWHGKSSRAMVEYQVPSVCNCVSWFRHQITKRLKLPNVSNANTISVRMSQNMIFATIKVVKAWSYRTGIKPIGHRRSVGDFADETGRIWDDPD